MRKKTNIIHLQRAFSSTVPSDLFALARLGCSACKTNLLFLSFIAANAYPMFDSFISTHFRLHLSWILEIFFLFLHSYSVSLHHLPWELYTHGKFFAIFSIRFVVVIYFPFSIRISSAFVLPLTMLSAPSFRSRYNINCLPYGLIQLGIKAFQIR